MNHFEVQRAVHAHLAEVEGSPEAAAAIRNEPVPTFQELPVLWYRLIFKGGADGFGVDMLSGEDEPDGDGWTPAFALPPHTHEVFAYQRKRIAELRRLCAEAYQVVGVLASDCGRFGDNCVTKILDNLSAQIVLHSDVLPFPSKEKSEKG